MRHTDPYRKKPIMRRFIVPALAVFGGLTALRIALEKANDWLDSK